MANVIRRNTIIGVEEESTEGTYVAPQAVTSYIQPLPSYDWIPSREVIAREILTGSIGKAAHIQGLKSVEATLPVEFRASGTEGSTPDFHSLLKCAFGASRNVTVNRTSTTSHTSTVINLTSGEGDVFSVGDMVLVKESGAYEVRPISAVATDSVTLAFALANGAPSDSVVLSKIQTYYLADSGHPSLSLSFYEGDEMRNVALGAKVTSLSFDNIQTGQVGQFNFGLKGLNYTLTNASAPHTPTYDSALPPIMLNTCIYMDGTALSLSNFSLSLSNELTAKNDLCDSNGTVSLIPSARNITGTINPYTSDTATGNFDKFVAGTDFALFGVAYTPSSTAGEISVGSIIAWYLPQCKITEFKPADQDGITVDQISFVAHRGNAGGSAEMYLSMI